MSFANGRGKAKCSKGKASIGLDSERRLETVEVEEEASVPRLDMNHGFIRSIVRNQVARDEYHKLIAEKNQGGKRCSEKQKKACAGGVLYVPPHLRNATKSRLDVSPCNDENPLKLLVVELAGENSVTRKQIRRRLEEELTKEAAERACSSSLIVEHTRPVAQELLLNEPLFKLDLTSRNGDRFEQIIYGNDNSARVAKAISRQLDLDDEQCRDLRIFIEEQLEKRLIH